MRGKPQSLPRVGARMILKWIIAIRRRYNLRNRGWRPHSKLYERKMSSSREECLRKRTVHINLIQGWGNQTCGASQPPPPAAAAAAYVDSLQKKRNPAQKSAAKSEPEKLQKNAYFPQVSILKSAPRLTASLHYTIYSMLKPKEAMASPGQKRSRLDALLQIADRVQGLDLLFPCAE